MNRTLRLKRSIKEQCTRRTTGIITHGLSGVHLLPQFLHHPTNLKLKLLTAGFSCCDECVGLALPGVVSNGPLQSFQLLLGHLLPLLRNKKTGWK